RGPGAGGDHDAVGGQLLDGGPRGDREAPRAEEARLAQVGAGVRAARAAVLEAAGGDRVDPSEDAVADVAPAHALETRVDPVPGGLADGGGDLGRVDEHLRGNAAHVEAGTAEGARLDDRDLQIV